ncbi:MAG TPA: hypothetical protein VLY04_05510 [Bryobacteraceae bacterium]|nr:hypothetical protein [Bryobacteraceae bacterium]
MRSSLVAALVSCVDSPLKYEARRFLAGLSSDELQFIAEFLGACILESSGRCRCSRAQLADRIARYQMARAGCAHCGSEDQDHKMILLLEYLCRSGVPQFSLAASASQAS